MAIPRFAIGVPNVGDYADPGVLCELAVLTEEHGWDGFFLWDHLLYRDAWDVADPWVVLSAAAVSTRRIRLGLLMAALPRLSPWEVAKRSTTLQTLSAGRFILGAGLGSMQEEYERFGMSADPATRGQRLDEALNVITTLWTGEVLDFSGRHYVVRGAALRPAGAAPVWIGGVWPNKAPFRRAARYQGVMPTHRAFAKGETMPPEDLGAILAYVRRYRTDAGPIEVALEGTTADGRSSGWEVVRRYATVGLTWWVEALGWWRGSVDDMKRRIACGPPSPDTASR